MEFVLVTWSYMVKCYLGVASASIVISSGQPLQALSHARCEAPGRCPAETLCERPLLVPLSKGSFFGTKRCVAELEH